MKRCYVVITCLCALLLCSCGHRYDAVLTDIDSLIDVNADSALVQLRKMDCPSSRSDRMYYYLLLADASNKCYDTLPSDSIMHLVTDFYDAHGTANEQVRAHYLLGCVYRDMGEAPQALDCYHTAVSCADTTARDCNYRLLMSVYGQMAYVFHRQNLPHDELDALKKFSKTTLILKDTLDYIKGIEMTVRAYSILNDTIKVVELIKESQQLYIDYGYPYMAIRENIIPIHYCVEKDELDKAQSMMQEYERESGLFDTLGNIAKGREAYYYIKGSYYIKTNQLDSAEHYMRRLLNRGHETDAYRGLLTVYQQKKNTDSIIKYARLYEDAVDTLNNMKRTEVVGQMQAMYNYTRHQEVARQKTIEANRSRQAIMAGSFVGLLVITLLLFALYRNRRKKQEEITLLQRQYEHDVDKLEQARYDLVRMQEEQLTRLMEEKEADIRELQRQVDAYGQQARPEDRLEGFLSETDSYRRFRHFIMHPQEKATLDDWKLLHDMIDQKLPAFRTTLYSAQPGLKASDYDICVLDRLYFTPSEIAMLTGKNLSSITMKRVRLLGKLFHVTGKGSQFDAFIRKIS